MCHMKTITIRELHHNTGQWVREAARFGEIHVTERGETIAKIVPQAPAHEIPYFARVANSPLVFAQSWTSFKAGQIARKSSPKTGTGQLHDLLRC